MPNPKKGQPIHLDIDLTKISVNYAKVLAETQKAFEKFVDEIIKPSPIYKVPIVTFPKQSVPYHVYTKDDWFNPPPIDGSKIVHGTVDDAGPPMVTKSKLPDPNAVVMIYQLDPASAVDIVRNEFLTVDPQTGFAMPARKGGNQPIIGVAMDDAKPGETVRVQTQGYTMASVGVQPVKVYVGTSMYHGSGPFAPSTVGPMIVKRMVAHPRYPTRSITVVVKPGDFLTFKQGVLPADWNTPLVGIAITGGQSGDTIDVRVDGITKSMKTMRDMPDLADLGAYLEQYIFDYFEIPPCEELKVTVQGAAPTWQIEIAFPDGNSGNGMFSDLDIRKAGDSSIEACKKIVDRIINGWWKNSGYGR